MGNFEKLVVLTLLFLSAVVLAFALQDDGAEAEGPLEGAVLAAEESAQVPLAADEPTGDAETAKREPAARTRGSLLLSSELGGDAGTTSPDAGRTAKDVGAERTPAGDGRILLSERGLSASGIEDYRVYAVAEGDTWSQLALRFFGNAGHADQLRTANEDADELVAGERILVPVYDFARSAGTRSPYRPQPQTGEPGTAPAESLPAAGKIYVVRDGDNLSTISKNVFGTATKWNEIYKANRDVLDHPDWLEVGMKLKIPKE